MFVGDRASENQFMILEIDEDFNHVDTTKNFKCKVEHDTGTFEMEATLDVFS